jgi:hypothetical protein
MTDSKINITPSSIKNSRSIVYSTGGKLDTKYQHDQGSKERGEKTIFPFESNSPIEAKSKISDSLEKIESENFYLSE